MNTVIVSRHLAAIEWIARKLGGSVHTKTGTIAGVVPEVRIPIQSGEPEGESGSWNTVPVLTGNVVGSDVQGKVVYGNLPMALAALTACVYVIEFTGTPPRGQEYSVEEMDKAGARLSCYQVIPYY